VGGIVLRGDSVLLVERGSEPLKGYWSLPGGMLETGESLAEGVRREVREETGLEVDPVAIVEVFERIMLDEDGRPEYHYVLIDYLCLAAGGTLAAASDANDARWVARGSLPEVHLTEGSLPVIEKAFGIYENLQR
jgi:8-oxo-dGTP diphosphatase